MPISVHAAELRLVKRFQVFSRLAAAVGVLTGSVTLLGWAFGIETLKSVLPGQVTLKPNAAVAFILCGVALWCLAAPATVGFRRKIGRACASLAALVGLLTLGEYVFSLNFGIDQLLFIEKAGAVGTFAPGRMAPLTALSFILIGLALLLLDVEARRGLRPAQLVVLPAAAISILAVLEYLFGIPTYFGIATFMRSAVHGAVAFLLYCAGVLCARPDRGLMMIATSDAQGGAMWRRLLPVAFLAPVLLAWIRLKGERAGYFGTEMGTALLATSLVAVLVSLIWWHAKSLDRTDYERRRMEDQTRASSLYARSLLEASLDPLVTISREGKITDVNQATELVTGVLRQRLVGSDFSDYFTEPEKARAGYQQVFREGSVQDYALEVRHQNGHITPVLYNATVFRNEAGEIQGVFAAARDITERKRVEEQLRATSLYARSLLEASLDPLVTINREGKITDVNRATELVTGVLRQRLVGSDFSDYFTEPEKARAGYQQVFREGSVQDYALEIRHQDGHITPVLYNATVFRNEAGEIQGVFAAARDITDRKRFEEDLKRSNAELQQFAYVASHDLQEPLRMVASYTQLLAQRYRGTLDSDADEFIGYAVDGAKRMQGLIEDLLAYSRVGTRARALRCCGCGQVVQKALQNLSVAITESGAAVEVADLPDINCDELQLETVFQNLIGNAIKFRDKRRPCVIQVSAHQDGPNWVFSVKDNGIGIESRHFERIFQVFQRLYTREEYPGSGIGLAISKKIIERHRGRIWLESQFGAGTTFFFTIPNTTIASIEEAANAASTH